MFEFAALPMLGALAAAAIPYLLLRSRRHAKRRIDWSTNRFLRQAIEKNNRSISLMQLLLLILRTLALIFLAVGVADPIYRNVTARQQNTLARAVIHMFVLDASASMDLRVDGSALIDVAKSKAGEICDTLNSYDVVAIISADQRANLKWIGDQRNRTEWKDALQKIEVQPWAMQLDIIENDLDSFRSRLRSKYPGIDSIVLHWISDWRSNDWNDSTLQSMEQMVASEKNLLVNLVDLETEARAIENLSVQQTRLTMTSPESRNLRVDLTLKNTGTVQVSREVRCIVNGTQIDAKEVSLQAGDRQNMSFELPSMSDEGRRVVLQVDKDDYHWDNEYYMVIPPQTDQAAMILANAVDDGTPLQLALQSLGVKAEVREQALAGADITEIHLIDPEKFTPNDQKRLVATVPSLTAIYVWLGPSFVQESGVDQGLGPATISNVEPWTEFGLPVVQDASDDSQQSWRLELPITKYWGFSQFDTDQWRPLLKMNGTTPFAFASTSRDVTTYVIPVSPTLQKEDDIWNTMAIWPTFIPFVYQLRAFELYEVLQSMVVGDTFGIPKWDGPVTIQLPDGIEQEVTSNTFRFQQPGFYRLHDVLGADSAVQEFASNVDASESDFQVVDLRALRESLDVPREIARATEDRPQEKGWQWSKHLLGGAIFLILVELLLTVGWRIRRLRRESTKG